ncbi:unnamed protein product [Calypogeia fissa]
MKVPEIVHTVVTGIMEMERIWRSTGRREEGEHPNELPQRPPFGGSTQSPSTQTGTLDTAEGVGEIGDSWLAN